MAFGGSHPQQWGIVIDNDSAAHCWAVPPGTRAFTEATPDAKRTTRQCIDEHTILSRRQLVERAVPGTRACRAVQRRRRNNRARLCIRAIAGYRWAASSWIAPPYGTAIYAPASNSVVGPFNVSISNVYATLGMLWSPGQANNFQAAAGDASGGSYELRQNSLIVTAAIMVGVGIQAPTRWRLASGSRAPRSRHVYAVVNGIQVGSSANALSPAMINPWYSQQSPWRPIARFKARHSATRAIGRVAWNDCRLVRDSVAGPSTRAWDGFGRLTPGAGSTLRSLPVWRSAATPAARPRGHLLPWRAWRSAAAAAGSPFPSSPPRAWRSAAPPAARPRGHRRAWRAWRSAAAAAGLCSRA